MARPQIGQGVLVDVPATTANIGPGFDCLGAALDLPRGHRGDDERAVELGQQPERHRIVRHSDAHGAPLGALSGTL